MISFHHAGFKAKGHKHFMHLRKV